MIHLDYYALGEYQPKIEGDYLMWDEFGKAYIAHWSNDDKEFHDLYSNRPIISAYMWAEIPSIHQLEFNYRSEK